MSIITRGSSRLTDKKRKELVLDLCESLAVLNDAKEVVEVLTDLFTPKEIETIAKRLQIAEYLADGQDYNYIRTKLRVGFSTIARVNTWLNLSGDGFKLILSRRKINESKNEDSKIEEMYDPYSWHNFKRRNSLNFWPQLLLEEIFKNADKKEKQKMQEIFEKIEIKRKRFTNEENKDLYDSFSDKLKTKRGNT